MHVKIIYLKSFQSTNLDKFSPTQFRKKIWSSFDKVLQIQEEKFIFVLSCI